MARLTEPQEKFAQLLVQGKSQYEAYLEAYPSSQTWKRNAVDSQASQLASDRKIIQRISTIRAPVIKKLQYGLEEAMQEALRAYDLAASTEQVGAMVAAAQLRAKLQGLLVERKEVKVTKLDDYDANEKTLMLESLKGELARRKALSAPEQDITDVEAK